jgi:thiol-disulfide isomerase/thioredoxin
MPRPLASLSLVLLMAGCTDEETSERPPRPDRDGDGGAATVDGGASDGGSGGDGGGGSDNNADDDGDGLTTQEESTHGTDPDRADSDNDGEDDGAEVAAGTNPLYKYSHSYEGGYNVGFCDEEPVPTGPTTTDSYGWPTYRKGDVADNFTLTDQYGEQVDLYSFCGQYVMLAFGAMWCGPCQQVAAEAQDLQDRYAADGFQMIEVLIEDVQGNNPDSSDLQTWESTYRMETVPVLDEGAQNTWPTFEVDYGIPTLVHLGPDMSVLSIDEGETDPGRYIP